MIFIKDKFHCVKQYDTTDCGAACLATVSKQYGLKIPITRIREIAGTDKQGTNAYGVIKAAEELGFSAKGVKGDRAALFSEFPLPAIAHVIVEGSLLHYMVIHKISKEKIIVADPAKGLITYAPDDFMKLWTGVLILLVPDVKFEKGDMTQGIFKRFFGLLVPQKNLVMHVFLASLLYTFLGILGAFYFKFLLDDILPYGLLNSLHVISIGIILLSVFKIILNSFRSYLLLYLSQRIDIPMILGYYNHVLDLPMNFFGTRKVGEIISRFMDAGKIRAAISGATLTIMIDTLMAIGGGIILYSYNASLFGIAVIMLIIYGVLVYAFNKPIREINRKQMEENSELTSYLIESLNGIETVKAFNAERDSKYKTEFLFIRLLKTTFKMGLISNVMGALIGLVGSVGGIVILWIGALNVLRGDLTIGQLLVFNALLAYFTDPVKNLINLQPMMQTAIVASDRLGEILDLEIEKAENDNRKMKPISLSGNIELKNIDFRYGTRDKTLKNINMQIKSGERIALVGESGSGKTTLVKLLLDLYSPEKGEILIHDNNIKDISVEVLRERIAYVPQETFLFSGTIEANLRLGTSGKTMDEIISATKLAKAHDFINELPLRYSTRLEENGANLSGGQRQRLSIARAILKAPDILILDEATSSLDSITEKAIEKTINTAGKGITTLIIAHRLSTIMKCDTIYVMEKGEIIEFGNHKDLINRNGKYYEMWKDQLPEFYGDNASSQEGIAS
ncbi:peptidase domain-containing ABC transporter [Fusibacter sp. 3D3]|uniref:peptidase domain-containing ABC transporter n=1 Tax=Fusibacter sp. 3D3 TaxID=1048380 RepID=UPI000853AADE|nr:peptidase domain-containing ABC transporter [Fusibacter sp. 3D3]GAU76488.1 lactacin F ABC transporter permease component [Fusibacter sp. 3D3]